MKHYLKKLIESITGYWFYKTKELSIGCDLEVDIKKKLGVEINTIFDVGANVGQSVFLFRKLFPKSEIISFEPFTSTFDTLLINTKKFSNVHCYKIGLGDIDSEILSELNVIQNSVYNKIKTIDPQNIEKKNTNIEKIKVTKGSTFCREHKIKNIDLLKIDTEGFELFVLNGFNEMIKDNSIKLILCEAGLSFQNTQNTHLHQLLDFFKDKPYFIYGFYGTTFKKNNVNDNFTNILFVNKYVL